ncbi:MAG: methionine synthase, partial [Eudoraea sp.]|nr:methionine synthase [Eudoraea sp.]
EAARTEQVDMVGLSGLITPSLDEMVYLAKEMQRQEFDIPILIGGATTSKAHTAVKIDPEYVSTVVHVNDASRAVTVVGDLMKEEKSAAYKAGVKSDYEQFRDKFLARAEKKEYLSYPQAVANKLLLNWKDPDIIAPKELGVKVIEDLDVEEVIPYIDWTPFFRSWDLHGKYPDILQDEIVGKQATELFDDAQEMLSKIKAEKWLGLKAIFGIFQANSIGDDIEVNTNDGTAIFRTLRQQGKKKNTVPNLALADFIAPKTTDIQDHIGCFCVSAGFGADEKAAEFNAALDDYSSILIKALADRLAEASAEYLHKKVRKDYWGYVSEENLNNEELIKESYKGIRPAPGYPACPDHLEKKTIWEILAVENKIGVKLTESLAMWPAASVSGYYFAHPESRYFGLGKIKEDQVADYAKRKGISLEEAKKWLGPNIVHSS